jgi:hypothetical protein
VRVAAWVFVVATVVSAICLFVPSIQLTVKGSTVGKKGQLSLYQAESNREVVRRLVVAYHKSSGRDMGVALVEAMTPKVGGKLRGYLSDARDAMDTLDDVTEDDARLVGWILFAVVWGGLALHLAQAALMFGDAVNGTFRRNRVIAGVVMSGFVALIAFALLAVSRNLVHQANDELGKSVVQLGPGAYLMPIASLAAVAAAVVVALKFRAQRQLQT